MLQLIKMGLILTLHIVLKHHVLAIYDTLHVKS